MTLSYRKVGGIHWLKLGRWRISLCRARRTAMPIPADWLPVELALPVPDLIRAGLLQRLYAKRALVW
ncbi:MAG TPA: hypothetical protein VF748_15130 [Candidatus Acidoferrum sp.]